MLIAQLTWQPIGLYKMTYEASKLGQTDLAIGLWLEFFNRSVFQDYKSLRLAAMICATHET